MCGCVRSFLARISIHTFDTVKLILFVHGIFHISILSQTYACYSKNTRPCTHTHAHAQTLYRSRSLLYKHTRIELRSIDNKIQDIEMIVALLILRNNMAHQFNYKGSSQTGRNTREFCICIYARAGVCSCVAKIKTGKLTFSRHVNLLFEVYIYRTVCATLMN